MQSIKVKHNMEVAHRLWSLPGKCEQIHGHGMWVHLEMWGDDFQQDGILLDYSEVKKEFRAHIDGKYDHHFLLDKDDPLLASAFDDWAQKVYPGVVECPGIPSVENISKWIGQFMRNQYGPSFSYLCTVDETSVNSASWNG